MNDVRHEIFSVPVLKNERISTSSIILRLPKYAAVKAGQVINITTNSTTPPRMYSIASGEQDEYIELLLKIVERGELTPSLKHIRSNDSLLVSNPFGGFLATEDPAWFIATGTGIAPYLSMIRSGYSKNKKLLHGSREMEDFYYSEYLLGELGNNYKQCYTGSKPNQVFKGRVTEYLKQSELIDPNLKYYLCGSAEMVVDTRQILIGRGVSFKNILSEIYF